jgi:ABC-type multidrug transport system fused ATPase/permease subunit
MLQLSTGPPEGLYVAKSAAIVVFLFATFATNYGRKKPHKTGILVRTIWRLGAVWLLCAFDISEATLTYIQHQDLGPLQARIVVAVLTAAAWASLGLRKQLYIPEILALSIISLCFSTTFLAIQTWQAVQNADLSRHIHQALFVVEPARLLVSLVLIIDCAIRQRLRKRHIDCAGEEARPFLASADGEDTSSSTMYGAAGSTTPTKHSDVGTSSDDSDDSSDDDSNDSGDDSDEDDDEKDPKSRATKLRKSGSWMAYIKDFKVFLPHLIPKNDYLVQGCLLLCLLVLAGGRVLNILAPRQLGIVTDKLYEGQLPYADMALYFFMDLIHGDSGLNMLESLAKIPVEQFSYRQLTNAAFSHVMGLGMEYHADHDSAEVMKSVEQGQALTNILEMAVLEMAPTVIDMCVAVVWLYIKFNSSVALCMLVASFLLLALEVVNASANVKNRRRVTRTQRKQTRRMHQAIQGWQTVWAFNMFGHEKAKYAQAVEAHLDAKKSWQRRDALISAFTESVGPITLFLLASLVIHEIYMQRATPGDFVFLISYWEYLVWPMRYLAHEYRYLIQDLVDAERLLDLLTTKAAIVDKQRAITLPQVEGRVSFEKVGFSYDTKRQVLKDIDIVANPGDTIALVGATGSGKSSLMKLLMRYYDVTLGAVKIDGHDIRDITLDSLRTAIGVVPQDPLLFNTSIMENLRYARLSATDDDIFEACRAAAIHDKILGFTDGYDTKVGESGVKLSGGEVQRLAIARAFLKDPPILILDEATSAVDTETEAEIQSALGRLSKQRTTFVVAHRLSTVVRADQILVMASGEVVERGTHEELLKKGERYAGLWAKQFAAVKEDEPLVTI